MSGRKVKTLEEALDILDASAYTLVPTETIRSAVITVREEFASLEGAWKNLYYRIYGAGSKPGGNLPWMRGTNQRESK